MGMLGREMRKVLTPEGIARVLIDEHVTSRASDVAPSARSPLVACLTTIQWTASNLLAVIHHLVSLAGGLDPVDAADDNTRVFARLPLHVRASITDRCR